MSIKIHSPRPDSLTGPLKQITIEFSSSGQVKEKSIIAAFVEKVTNGSEVAGVHLDDWRVLSSVPEYQAFFSLKV